MVFRLRGLFCPRLGPILPWSGTPQRAGSAGWTLNSTHRSILVVMLARTEVMARFGGGLREQQARDQLSGLIEVGILMVEFKRINSPRMDVLFRQHAAYNHRSLLATGEQA
jgi:hypothetical protein